MSSAPACTIIVHIAGDMVNSPPMTSGHFGSAGGFSSFGSLSNLSMSPTLQSSPSFQSLAALSSGASHSLPDESLLLPPGGVKRAGQFSLAQPTWYRGRKMHPAYSPAPGSGDRCVLIPSAYFEKQQQQAAKAKPQADECRQRGRTLVPTHGASIFRPTDQRLEDLRKLERQQRSTRAAARGRAACERETAAAAAAEEAAVEAADAAAVEVAVGFESACAVAACGTVAPVVNANYIRFTVGAVLLLTRYWFCRSFGMGF